mmetsp:Transcript_21461/g.55771  ORF Transcript_21461/g.55771 Transcript_21461/m.55771 type:complete len:527 (-) Transcript_21461:107-1687(-)
MQKAVEVVEPTVIDEQLIRDCVHITAFDRPGGGGEASAAEKKREIDIEDVETLMFSFKNVLRIDNLVGLDSLTKLQLDNNIIKRIENIGHLTNLTWLDLSFNNIEKIEGLKTLTKLTDLSLYSNQIGVLENMDELEGLQVLSVGANDIKTLENLMYLRRFNDLRVVNLEGNPVSKDAEYRAYVMAHVKSLKYLDYRLLDQKEVVAAKEQFQDELLQLEEHEHADDVKRKQEAEIAAERKKHAEANLQGVATLLETMQKENPELPKLKLLSFWDESFPEYKEVFEEHLKKFIDKMLEYDEKKKKEVKLFEEALDEARKHSQQSMIKLISSFNDKKKELFRESSNMRIEDVRSEVKGLRNENEELLDKLLDLEMAHVEHHTVMVKSFDENYEDLVRSAMTIIDDHFRVLREHEDSFNEQNVLHAEEEYERYSKGNSIDDISEDALAIVQDKETLMNCVSASHEVHMELLANLEEKLKGRETGGKNDYMNNMKANESQRNRSTVAEAFRAVEKNRKDLKEHLLAEEEAL